MTSPGGRAAPSATAMAMGRSVADPVTSTRRPAARSEAATAAKRAGGQRRAGLAAPGWMTVAPVAPAGGGPGGWMARSAGSAAMPLSVRRRHQRATSCSSASHRGPPAVAGTAGWAKATRRRGLRATRRGWLPGPRPWRSMATSGPPRAAGRAPRPAVGATAWTAPTWATRGTRAGGAASTRRWSGNARATALRAGTPVRKSPRPRARRMTTVGAHGPRALTASARPPGAAPPWSSGRRGRGPRPPGLPSGPGRRSPASAGPRSHLP